MVDVVVALQDNIQNYDNYRVLLLKVVEGHVEQKILDGLEELLDKPLVEVLLEVH